MRAAVSVVVLFALGIAGCAPVVDDPGEHIVSVRVLNDLGAPVEVHQCGAKPCSGGNVQHIAAGASKELTANDQGLSELYVMRVPARQRRCLRLVVDGQAGRQAWRLSDAPTC